ncbi:MAG TPA: anaerobic ribonucleoside-triphosphate reductase [Patescibacteria group bacterium]|nr:anaerobic ribonucleoside-triphosphate reductase [Patescibacteria group bacterium]
MIIDGICVEAQDGITEQEMQAIAMEERQIWARQGKEVAEIKLTLEGDEIVIQSVEKSPINRVRRITGYLAPVHNFNASKKAELADRFNHM